MHEQILLQLCYRITGKTNTVSNKFSNVVDNTGKEAFLEESS